MHHLNIQLNSSSHQYPIIIAPGLWRDAALLRQHLPARQLCWVSQASIWPHYGAAIQALLPEKEHLLVLLEEGEDHKNWAAVESILNALLAAQFGRDALLVTLGGGLVGDVGGFAASIHQRGIPFVNLPSSLLAQVDASIGGKTGINHPRGKNLIGSFHQPRAVLMDSDALNTLPPREWAAGWAEIIKYALIQDEALFAALEQQSLSLQEVIARCCQHKAQLVMEDEREQGRRALLNLGHTFGHAFERLGDYRYFNHGEAVAVGLLAALHLSRILGYAISEAQIIRCEALLQRHGLPQRIPADWSPEALWAAMQNDKKKQRGRLRFILQKRFCEAFIVEDVPAAAVLEALAAVRAP